MHSDIVGGSTVERVSNCPGSVALVKEAPPQPESTYAAEGSLLHDCMESLLLSGPYPDAATMLGVEGHGHTVDLDHVAALHQALEDWNLIADRFDIEDFDCEVLADWGARIPGAFGSIDVIGAGPTHNLILDWKFGAGVRVSAEDNQQLLFYAAGASLSPKLADLFNPDLPTVIAIVQPRVEDGTTYQVVQPERLRQFIETVVMAVKRAQQPNAPLNSGKWCRWCPAKTFNCSKKLGLVANTPAITTSDLSHLLDLAEEVEDWAKSVRELANSEADNGRVPDGWKLVQRRSTRKWTDETDAEAALRGPGYRMKVVQICERKLKSPPQIEKILKAHNKVLPDDVVTGTASGTTLVRESDKRPALLPIAKALEEYSQ